MTANDHGRSRATGRALMPASALPFAYFVIAHASIAAAFVALVLDPRAAGEFFYHPRMIALVHLVTLGWISGSILGALHIVAPLVLRIPMPVRSVDWVVCGSFGVGVMVMVWRLWLGDYDGMVAGAVPVTAAILWVGGRVIAGLPSSGAPAPVLLHVVLAFVNVVVAAVLGVLIGLDRSRGSLGIPPMAAAFAHAHLAAIGWAAMMVVGLSYRLIPMILPAEMPTGWRLGVSAVLLETGLLLMVFALVANSAGLAFGAILVVAGFSSFAMQMRKTVRRKLPRPPALPRRDWSAWQAHGALFWLPVAAVSGLVVATGAAGDRTTSVQWIYGVAGLIGFLSQIVVGMAGRLIPLYAWYRAFAARDGVPPARAANDLPNPRFARPLFLVWSFGVPVLAVGLTAAEPAAIRLGAALLVAGVAVSFAYIVHLLRVAKIEPGA